MDKKAYASPEITELGKISSITKYFWSGEGFDGAFPARLLDDDPDNDGEIFGS